MPSIWLPTARADRRPLQSIDAYRAFHIGIQFNLAAPAATFDLTAGLTTAAATGGANGQALSAALTPSAGVGVPGVMVGTDAGLVPINAANDGSVPADAGDEVYVRMAEAAGVYTASFMKSDGAGGDTAVMLPAGDYVVHAPYRASIEEVPEDFAIRSIKHRVSQDAPSASLPVVEHLGIVALNTFPALANAPRAGTAQRIHHNGVEFFTDSPAPKYAVVGTAVSINAGNSTYDVYPGDRFSVEYVI